ncbi:MAG: hypothetical protein GXP27_00425 [Planctomycetes bacterium]|nr:hypothetical protein [Planctomycetota bacterium]
MSPYEVLTYPLIDVASPSLESYRWIYVPFNIGEAAAWFAIASFVGYRYAKHRQTGYELLYAASFLLFGATDLIEIHSTTVWLLGFKAACLLAILLGRKLVIGYYPGAKF